jgi:hypothetical protein
VARSIARRETGVLPDALWTAPAAINDRGYYKAAMTVRAPRNKR